VFLIFIDNFCTVCALYSLKNAAVRSSRIITTKTSLSSVFKTHETFLDGAEWISVQKFQAMITPNDNVISPVGKMEVVIGTIADTGERVAGVRADAATDSPVVSLDDDCFIYIDSVASIPSSFSEKDYDTIIMTISASLASVHCALPIASRIGGSSSDFTKSNGKVVVIGASDHARFAARGLSSIGMEVFLISTGNTRIDDSRITVLNPSVGDMEIGFCSYIGEFDSIVDTVSDEQTNVEFDDSVESWRKSGVLTLLRTRHNCEQYISTMTQSQKIIEENGLLFGPGKVKEHLQRISKNSARATSIRPPNGFGKTVQTLLENGITLSWKSDGEGIIRSWSVPQFWELASWPRDAAGSNVRFGLPVVDDLDTISNELEMFEEGEREKEKEELQQVEKSNSNPFVEEISGVNGLAQNIVDEKRNALLFLSAPFCRTCKSLSPGYTRLARTRQESGLMFAKANTSGPLGKELGRKLAVNSVPMFLLFRDGERFGKPLSINKLPSKTLDQALEYLTTGSEWDSDALDAIKVNERRKN